MALLQISEPGMSPEPHQRRLAVGIDLGTTHSLVASVRSSAADVLPDELGRPLLPSVVRYLAGGEVEVGHVAWECASEDPRNTIHGDGGKMCRIKCGLVVEQVGVFIVLLSSRFCGSGWKLMYL